MHDPFIIEGYLNLESQEGGYVQPGWRLDGKPLDEAVAQHFGVVPANWKTWSWETNYPYVPSDQPVSRVRITIERLEETAERKDR